MPVCPLCNKPIPIARGERPDKRVSDHIDSNCKSNPAIALKGKIYTHHCSQQNCKKREVLLKFPLFSERFCFVFKWKDFYM